MIELHHLKHFVKVAETLHFRQAALRLNMAQPALSQSIRRLEALLGVQLFERATRRVTLTVAGKVFLDESRQVLNQAGFAIRAAQLAASGESGELRIGFVTGALFKILPRTIRIFRDSWPLIRLRLDERQMEDQIAGLKSGEIDAAFLYTPFRGSDGLEFRTLAQDRFLVAIPKAGPLAGRKTIRLEDLANEPFIMFPYRQGPEMHAAIMAACRASGFIPHISQEAERIHTMLSLVGSGLGVTLVQESAASMPVEGVEFVPLEGKHAVLTWGLGLVWRPPIVSTALGRFLKCVDSGLDG